MDDTSARFIMVALNAHGEHWGCISHALKIIELAMGIRFLDGVTKEKSSPVAETKQNIQAQRHH
jgi:hypothetical protein